MSHMGDNCRNNYDTNQGLMDEIETKTKFDAKCMWQIQYEKGDKNKKRNSVSIEYVVQIWAPFFFLFLTASILTIIKTQVVQVIVNFMLCIAI